MSTCVNKGDHLLVEVRGTYSLKYMLSTIHEVAEHCRADNLSKVLIDLRELEGDPGIFDRFQIGIEIVKTWDSRIKAAVIARPNVISRMAENTAVNRGARVFITSEMDAALKWLELETQDQTIGE